MRKLLIGLMVISAITLTLGGLTGFMWFAFFGPVHLVNLNLNKSQVLWFDAGLSFMVFLQHSIMIRKSFRKSISWFIPEEIFRSFFAIVSGLTMLTAFIHWQPLPDTIFVAEGIWRLLFRGIFFASLLGTLWVLLTIWFYDPSGTLEVIYYLKGKPAAKNNVKADGLFLLVRHPIYMLMILMMWSYPDITTDRLLFNVLWTTWMLAASFLEERDLIADHGKSYLNYRKRVPMFIPNGSSISAIKERFRKGTGLSF